MPVLLYEKKDKIAYLTLNRPEAMNALDAELGEALREAWTDFARDDDVWIAIVTGAGDRAFCAGMDLVRTRGARFRPEVVDFLNSTAPSGAGYVAPGVRCWKPIIAAVNGYAVGGGLELALRCDIRLASDNAQLGLGEVRWSLVPGSGTQSLPRAIPMGVALEMIFTGQRVSAQRAYELGLVNKVTTKDQLIPEATKLAETILENGPIAVRACKEAVWKGLDMTLEEGLRNNAFLARAVRETEDAKEGPKAFAEKRKPVFKGR